MCLVGHGYNDHHSGAVGRPTGQGKASANALGTLSHADQPKLLVRGSPLRIKAPAIVCYAQAHRRSIKRQGELDGAGLGVFHGVDQGFLTDAQERVLYLGGKRTRGAVDLHLRLQGRLRRYLLRETRQRGGQITVGQRLRT
jgi:hypothetical protein